MIATIICMLVLMCPAFGNNALRAGVFILFGFAVLIPVIFLCYTYDPVYSLTPDLGLYGIGLLTYIIALVIYLGRVPERWFPGKFDYLGSSHQIWHLLVMVGAYVTLTASYEVYVARVKLVCPS